MKVGVIDYGMGNIFSVTNTLNFLGVENELCSDPKKLIDFQKLILPGVGSFYDCIKKLSEKKFIESLNYNVIEMKKPILGICLGMQVMAKRGYNDLEETIDRITKQKELCQELLKNAGLKIKVLESRCKLLEEKVEFEKKNQDILRDHQTIELLQKDSIITKLENERKKAEDKTYENEKEEKKSN